MTTRASKVHDAEVDKLHEQHMPSEAEKMPR